MSAQQTHPRTTRRGAIIVPSQWLERCRRASRRQGLALKRSFSASRRMRRVPDCWPTMVRWQQNREIDADRPASGHRRSRPHQPVSPRAARHAETMSQKRGHGIQGGARRAETAHAGREAVCHLLLYFHFHVDPGRSGAFSIPARIIQQDLVGADMEACRRQAGHAAIDGRCGRIQRIVTAEIAFNETSHPSAGQVWIGLGGPPKSRRSAPGPSPETAPPLPPSASARDPPGAAPGHRRLSHQSKRRAARHLRPRQDSRHARLPSLQQTGAREQADNRAQSLEADPQDDLPAQGAFTLQLHVSFGGSKTSGARRPGLLLKDDNASLKTSTSLFKVPGARCRSLPRSPHTSCPGPGARERQGAGAAVMSPHARRRASHGRADRRREGDRGVCCDREATAPARPGHPQPGAARSGAQQPDRRHPYRPDPTPRIRGNRLGRRASRGCSGDTGLCPRSGSWLASRPTRRRLAAPDARPDPAAAPRADVRCR